MIDLNDKIQVKIIKQAISILEPIDDSKIITFTFKRGEKQCSLACIASKLSTSTLVDRHAVFNFIKSNSITNSLVELSREFLHTIGNSKSYTIINVNDDNGNLGIRRKYNESLPKERVLHLLRDMLEYYS